MPRIKKGDVCVYTGPYAPAVPATARYGKGQVVGFRNYGETVTVRLIEEAEELYADWPRDETRKVEASSPCCNHREDLDEPCTGTALLFPGEPTYVCDTCGARCGRLVHPRCGGGS